MLAERTVRRAAIFLLFYGLHLTSGCYFAYMIHFPLAAILASRWAAEGRRRLLAPASLRVLVPVAALTLAAAVALFLPYLRLDKRLGMIHDDHEIGRNGAALASYFSPAPQNLYSPYPSQGLWDRAGLPRWQQPVVRSENSLFAGFLPTLLAGFGLWELWRRYRVGAAPALAIRQRLLLWVIAAAALTAFALGDVYTLRFAQDLPPLDRWTESAAWTALGVVLLVGLGLLLALRRRFAGDLYLRWGEMDPWHRGLLLAGLLCFALSFPLVYFPLMRVVPGLASMRVPARFAAFVSLTVAFLAGWGLDRLVERLGLAGLRRRLAGRGRAVAFAGVAGVSIGGLALGALLALELAPRPVRWVEVLTEDEFPDVYGWIRGRREIRALVEIPLRPNWTEATYMYYSTSHWKPIANGYSSFVPASYEQLASQVRLPPDGDGLSLLESMGITHIVVHADQLIRRAADPAAAEARGAAMVRDWERRFLGRRIELVYRGDPERVYRLIPRSAGSAPTVPGGPAAR